MTRLGSQIPMLEALDGHCQRLGRDRSEIEVSLLTAAVVAPTMEQADTELRATAAVKGWNDEVVEPVKAMLVSKALGRGVPGTTKP